MAWHHYISDYTDHWVLASAVSISILWSYFIINQCYSNILISKHSISYL